MSDDPVLPEYAGACVCNLVPALLEPSTESVSWIPEFVHEANQIVLLVIDGLGWDHLQERRHVAPTMAAMTGRAITTVAPSTTATALTSIATGLAPGEHGVIGYRINVGGEILNVLRWTTPRGDARLRIPPTTFQKAASFASQHPPIVTKAEFYKGGFSGAHLEGTRFHGYRCQSTMLTELRRLLRSNEPFIYTYYDGPDKVSHEYGLGEYFDAEVAATDRLIADIIAELPPGAVLVVTADHGQVHTGDALYELPADVLEHVAVQSGEARLRWLHARGGRTGALLEAVEHHFGDLAWIRTRAQVIDEQWFGPHITVEGASRLGDVAMAANGVHAFVDPADTGPYKLIGRHGSLTRAEMLVPLLAHGNF
jgi:predicted AlkP superfamily pyrophosphatase or phosphodiesterase